MRRKDSQWSETRGTSMIASGIPRKAKQCQGLSKGTPLLSRLLHFCLMASTSPRALWTHDPHLDARRQHSVSIFRRHTASISPLHSRLMASMLSQALSTRRSVCGMPRKATQCQGLSQAHLLVLSIAFSPDGKYVSRLNGQDIRVWDAETGNTVSGPFEGHTSSVESVAFSPDASMSSRALGTTPSASGIPRMCFFQMVDILVFWETV